MLPALTWSCFELSLCRFVLPLRNSLNFTHAAELTFMDGGNLRMPCTVPWRHSNYNSLSFQFLQEKKRNAVCNETVSSRRPGSVPERLWFTLKDHSVPEKFRFELLGNLITIRITGFCNALMKASGIHLPENLGDSMIAFTFLFF